ncbi:MAG: VCBS repeat-containing protein, partial [Saprospiraceae bacterium]|nr:VCBS repeat-containing protein [Saprospiraceae bacterium]
ADMADINNDGLPEIFVTEMLPRSEERYKTKMTFENWDKYQLAVRSGYHHQFTRNVLQLNNGNNSFSEIGRLANVHATDWSWSALIADLDNDGWKDIYVSNGIYKDLLDQDYIHYYSNEPQILEAIKNKEPDAILQLIDRIPSQAISNFAFRNNRDLTFDDYTEKWGLETPSFSNGSAYGDLDNDGDLDLVVNNVNMPAFVFRNNLNDQRASSNYLQIILKGEGMNTQALGSQITAHHRGQITYQELSPMRGFQSCTDYKITFGLGKSQIVDSLVVRWPDSRITRLTEVPPNQLLLLNQRDAIATKGSKGVSTTPLFHEITSTGLDYKHQESEFIDFDRDRLLFHMISAEGPRLCTGDINGDGLEDIFVGGAAGQAGAIFLQERDGSFTLLSDTTLGQDRAYEDLDATFFDADGDGDLDLFVCSGSNEFQAKSLLLADRLYLNDGGGRFERSHEAFDDMPYESSSCVVAADYDEDGDNDLFVGTRLLPGVYGVPVTSTLWKNNSQGKFSSVAVPALQQVGMVTDAAWLDIDQDQDLDLVMVGEWMPVTVLRNDDGMLTNATSQSGFARTNGLWNCIEVADLDNDGHLDLVLGNHGLNSRLKASSDKPMTLYVNDFDGNRTAEQLLCMYNGEESYPLALRHDLVMQLPGLKKDYLLYENYKLKTSQDLFSEREIGTAAKSDVYQLASCVAWNDWEGHFDIQSLPIEAQFSPVYATLVSDYDKDGRSDILLAGNLLRSKPEVGTYHASFGTILLGDADRAFRALGSAASGLNLEGEVRDIERIQVNGKETILVARNNQPLVQLQVN